jgi:hypothetical protein
MPEMMPLNPSPGPYVASDSGSISSGYVPEFYGYPGAGYYPVPPQPFTPEPGMQPGMHPMTHKQHPSFSGQAFYPGPGGPVRPRSSSPLNPYASGGTVYFLPTHLPPQQKAPMVGPDGVPRSPASDMDPALAHAHAHAHPYGYEGGYPAFYHPYNAPDGGVFYAHHPYYPHPYDPAAYGYEPAHEGEYPVY